MTEEIIIDGVDVAGCEYYYRCDCKINDDTDINLCKWHDDCYYKQLKRLEQELKWANDEEKYLKECCIKAGKELEKNSFAWDGKEKNLVVQALELNERYEILEQENKDLKKQIESDKGLITVGGKQQYQYLQRIDELEQENKELKELNKKICEDCSKEIKVYWNALEEIREIAKDIIENDVYENSDVKAEKILDKINEVLNG